MKPDAKGPLAGLKILDLTLFLSGPYGTQILGDMGADVVKVEPPGGDNTRHLPPHFVGSDSVYFGSLNRNKKSIVLDYKTDRGREILERLAADADVMIENLKPGALSRYGITQESMRALNPKLIYCAISGFGQEGADRARPAYDMVVQAISGGMSITGPDGGPAVRAGIPIADISAGLYAVIGILGALHERSQTGQGKYVDVSMLDCQIAMLSYQAAYYLASGDVPGPQGRGHASIPTYRSFKAGDGKDFVMCANTDRMWRSLCDVLGRQDMLEDQRLADRKGRYAHRHEIWDWLDTTFAKRGANEWVEMLRKADVPVGRVNTLDEALTNEQVLLRQMVLEMENEDGAQMRVSGDPIKFPGSGYSQAHAFPPVQSEHAAEVMRSIGLSPDEIEAMFASGLITRPARAAAEFAGV